MKNLVKFNSKKIVIAALFLGGVSLGFAQTDSAKTEQTAVTTNPTQTANPAIDGLKKQIEANPNDTDAIVKLATAYQDANDWNGALETWKKMSTLLPDWAPSYYSQAYVYQNMKDEGNAKLAYEKYIAAVKPEEVEANKKNLAYAYFFSAFKNQETDKELAKTQIAKSLQYDPANDEAVKLSAFLNQ